MRASELCGYLRARRSAITFDLGAAGTRLCQFRGGHGPLKLVDALQIERGSAVLAETPAAPTLDPAVLAHLVGQGHFVGHSVALVLSAPEVQFFPLRVPQAALDQPPERLMQALKFEVARESRSAAESLEVRYWLLPRGHLQANVMAVALPAETTHNWSALCQQHGLTLRGIDVAPAALVQLIRLSWTPGPSDLWGVLDLGLRHSTLTVVVGHVPAYIRTLSVSSHQWTRRLAEAFEIPLPAAEQLKRDAATRLAAGGTADDVSRKITDVLRDPLRTLTTEIERCYAYIMQSFPDHTVQGLWLTGGGSRLATLPATLESDLGIPVKTVCTHAADPKAAPAITTATSRVTPEAGAAFGAALIELCRPADPLARSGAQAIAAVNLVPVGRFQAHARRRRQSAWVVACTVAGVLAAAGWGIQRTLSGMLVGLARKVDHVELQCTEAQRQLIAGAARRSQLLAQLNTIATARRPQTWAQRLVDLTSDAPDGVFLTAIQIGSTDVSSAPAPANSPPRVTASPPPGKSAPPPTAEDSAQRVRLTGYATDHAALIQLLNTLQNEPGWRQVELVRATSEPLRSGFAVAFELACLTREDQP